LAVAAAWRLAGFAAALRLAGFAAGYGRPVSNVPARTLSPEYHMTPQKM
jgi:hypothetical protein